MKYNRMSNADMLQYCKEALAWKDFGPIDIYFFESVRRILLGQCSPVEDQEDMIGDLMGVERPVSDKELEPEYHKYADIYYNEEGDDEIPDYSMSEEEEAFSDDIFRDGFFETVSAAEEQEDTTLDDSAETDEVSDADQIFTVNI
ncbi:MAG: hypothetical protein IKK47_03905 [Ruminococcus sp.]|nr:hypothetical protein [Ruminococcus sp.]